MVESPHSSFFASYVITKLGHQLDAELQAQLGFAADILVDERDREKKTRDVELTSENGERVRVGKWMKPKDKLYIKLPNAISPITIAAEDAKELVRLAEKKKKELRPKYGEFTYTEKTELPTTERFHFKNSVSTKVGEIGFGGISYLRGIGKIMLNFYLTRFDKLATPTRLLDFVNGKSPTNIIFSYHPSEPACLKSNKEFSHVIHIRGESEINAVYCYIELFNFENYLCIIDEDYDGDDFHVTYCYDCIANSEIEKEVNIRIYRHSIEFINIISFYQRRKRQLAFHEFEKRIELIQDLPDGNS